MSDTKYTRAAPLLEAEIDDEIVGLDREQGKVFGFNGVASEVWRLLAQPQSLAQLCARLQETYSVDAAQCEEDVTGLIEQLSDMGLVRRVEG
ncbi:PqqD family protein [Sphingomonas mesophila]|uniref:PqqD family protein n=1 Tax=Sphingomonas mesophila TaxID=2303576 RepID=UPI0013C2BAAF|nr:PqqD family protein [Sphingomonas mesophila]